MEFDARPISLVSNLPFTSRYMEAKVLEDFKLLNEITENYNFGLLTESEALSMLDIVNEDEGTLTERAFNMFELFETGVVDNILNTPLIEMDCFIGEAVLPFKEIVNSGEEDSIYNEYTFERTWDDSSIVGKVASSIADFKLANLNLYKESKGNEGFTSFERNQYAAFPDNRIFPSFVYEQAINGKILSGAIPIEEGAVLKEFVRTRFTTEDVAGLSPIIPLTGKDGSPDLSDVSIKDMVSSTDAEASEYERDPEEERLDSDLDTDDGKVIYGTIKVESTEEAEVVLRNLGAFIALESSAYKNNVAFDSEIKKLFMKLKDDIKMKVPNDPEESFKNMLSVKKDNYVMSFSNTSADPKKVSSTIVSCGFTPIKENNVIVRYEKTLKDIKIIVEFTSIDTGIIASYQPAGEVVKESALDRKIEYGLDCEASDVRDAAKRVKKLRENKDTPKEDFNSAVNNLDHAIENFKKVEEERKKKEKEEKEKEEKEKEVKESASNLLSSLHNIHANHNNTLQWYEESGVNGLPENHPMFGKTRDEFIFTKESVINQLYNLLNTNSSDIFVSERKELMKEGVNNYLPFFIKDNIGYSFEDLLLESPSKKVVDTFYGMMEKVYNEDVTEEEFNAAITSFVESVQRQKETEEICETVLNAVEFEEDTFTESEKSIDEDIKPTIDLLNKLGYTVKYSCSGHNRSRINEDGYKDGVYHGKIYTTARVTFDKKYNFKSIPEGWYRNKYADTTSIYVRPLNYNEKDGTPNEAFTKWKASYMKSLKDWVDNLESTKDEVTAESVMDLYMNEIYPKKDPKSLTFDDFVNSMMESVM